MNTYWKRILSIVLLCMLLLTQAHAEDSVLLPQELQSEAMELLDFCAMDGKLYLSTSDGMYYYDGTCKPLAIPNEKDRKGYPRLLQSEQKLYGFDPKTGVITPLLGTDTGWAPDWTHFLDEESASFPNFALLFGETLFLQQYDEENGTETLLSLDLQSNALQTLSIHPQRIWKRNESEILFATEAEDGFTLQSYHIQSGEVQNLNMQVSNPDEVGVYESEVYLVQQDEEDFALTAPDGSSRHFSANQVNRFAILDKEHIAVDESSLFFVRRLREADTVQPTLRIGTLCGVRSDTQDALRRYFPSYKIEYVDLDDPEHKTLYNALKNGEPAVDLLTFDNYAPIQEMMEKGYLLPLDEELNNFVQNTYDYIRSALSYEGKAYVLPTDMELTLASHDLNLFADEEQYPPKTLEEYVQLALHCHGGTQPADYFVSQSSNPKEELMHLALSRYIDHMRAKGEHLRFDTPRFRALMQSIQPLHLDTLPPLPYSETTEKDSFTYQDYTYDYTTERYANGRDGGRSEYLAYSLDKDSENAIKAYLIGVAVPHNTSNPVLAKQMMQAVYTELNPMLKTMLQPAQNEPIPNPAYPRMRKELEDAIAECKKNITDYPNSPHMQVWKEELEWDEMELENLRTTEEYLLSTQDILNMRKKTDIVYLPTSLQNAESSSIAKLFDEYIGGLWTLNEFIQSADGILQMVQAEGK